MALLPHFYGLFNNWWPNGKVGVNGLLWVRFVYEVFVIFWFYWFYAGIKPMRMSCQAVDLKRTRHGQALHG